MPIQIDTSKDITQQIQTIDSQIKVNKQITPKYFSADLTGGKQTKIGFFNKESDALKDFVKTKTGPLSNNGHFTQAHLYNTISTLSYHEQFETRTKTKEEKYFEKYSTVNTSIIPPIAFSEANYSGLKAKDLILPSTTPLYNINTMTDHWLHLDTYNVNGDVHHTYGKLIVQSVDLFSKVSAHTDQKTGKVKAKNLSASLPFYYLALVSRKEHMAQDFEIGIIGRFDTDQVTDDHAVMNVRPIGPINYSYEPHYSDIIKNINDFHDNLQGVSTKHYNISQAKTDFGELSMYDLITSQAINTAVHTEDILVDTLTAFSRQYEASKTSKGYEGSTNPLSLIVQHIDVLNDNDDELITTDLLSTIYQAIDDNISDITIKQDISRHSLRLLLSQRLNQLKDARDNGQLHEFKPEDKAVEQAMDQSKNYSRQQKRIITTTDPLVIGQAGAGSGKSHTLVGRINYLKDQGEDISKVLVLSFTNVAALNINERFPEVRSETLANMFNTIYRNSYPLQKLSQPATVASAMSLLSPGSNYFKNQGFDEDTVSAFIDRLGGLLKMLNQTGFKRVNIQQVLKLISQHVQSNLKLTISVLDAIEQTTLELQPIIIHHQLFQSHSPLNVPEEYQELEYIITDESQDISTFEYILLLEMTLHYGAQLLIIGDGSQTLYEFRNSDPRYMNALESSGVFTSHKLETNYRSKQEILTYANQFLNVIDANKYAEIQLQSANFASITPESFDEAVTVDPYPLEPTARRSDYIDILKEYTYNNEAFIDWFIERVDKGEQVALMAWTRAEVTALQDIVEDILRRNNLGHIPVTNIMSDNKRPMTILSRIAEDRVKAIRKLDPISATYLKDLMTEVETYIHNNMRHSSSKQVDFYKGYVKRNLEAIFDSNRWKALLNDIKYNGMSKSVAAGVLLQEMLRMETRHNATEQYLNKQNEKPDISGSKVIVSTIHGTKGLEFDHTVVLFNETRKNAVNQESLRMLFVALSRARISEYIMNVYTDRPSRKSGSNSVNMYDTPIDSAYLAAMRQIEDNQATEE